MAAVEDDGPQVPETHVLAVASHVTSGYVGNTMATFCLQTLGCEVSAVHTVNYSNHVGYKRVKGRKTSPEEVAELYQGLQDAGLNRFDAMLSGYCPSAALVEEVGKIAREQKLRSATAPGSFFWALDPVMGDNGRIYVAEDTVPAYKNLLTDADLILPNQFEAELLSGVQIHDLPSMTRAISTLHHEHRIAHILITSIRLPPTQVSTPTQPESSTSSAKLTVIGSTATSSLAPRLFRISVPALPVFFSGTGDMFAALLLARLREAAQAANLLHEPGWRSTDDSITGPELPLAKAAELVLASMHAVLRDTATHYDTAANSLKDGEGDEETRHLRLTRAAEVRVVRNAHVLRHPPNVHLFRAQPVPLEDYDG